MGQAQENYKGLQKPEIVTAVTTLGKNGQDVGTVYGAQITHLGKKEHWEENST